MEFAEDFDPPRDAEYGWDLGGFGGVRQAAPRSHLPVIFVHGNQGDAQNWHVVRDQFRDAGWSDQELWALSYGGLGYVGGSAPSDPSDELAYVAEHPQAGIAGNPQANDVNVPDFVAFLASVQDYTDSRQVHVVAHSLGVTIVRKALLVHPELRKNIAGAVMIAGANHGTSICRGAEESYYGCDEIAPDSPWLLELNAAGEAPGPTRWMTVYDGSGQGDVYYHPLDADSPRLEGADRNQTWPGTSHNDLRVDQAIVADYLGFLESVEGQLTQRPTETTGILSAPGANRDLPATGGGLAGALVIITLSLPGLRTRALGLRR